MRALAVLTVRNEGAFLLEWLAHHQAIGFTDFLVYSNDCDDGTDAMLDRLATLGHLTHVRNDGPHDKRGIQFTALNAAQKQLLVAKADWICCLDVDEFVNIHVGDGSIPALLEALPEASAITLTWRLFGNGDVVAFHDQPVTEQFQRCAPAQMYWPWRAAMFKTLYRNDGTYTKLGVHRPRAPNPQRIGAARWFDGHGRRLPDHFAKRQIFSPYGRPNHGLVQLNHYPLGAMQSYVLKSDRGRAVHQADRLGLDYWVERNFNQTVDTTILRTRPARMAAHDALMADPDLAALHKAAVAWRHERFDALMHVEDYRTLFGRLMMSQPSRVLGRQAATALVRYARKSQNPA